MFVPAHDVKTRRARARAHTQQLGGAVGAHFRQICRMLQIRPRTLPHRRELRRDRSALRLVEVSALQVEREDVLEEVRAGADFGAHLDLDHRRSSVAALCLIGVS
jgi:hypothetical protein